LWQLNPTPYPSWQKELDGVSVISYILLIQLLHGLCTTLPCSSCDMTLWLWHLWCDTFLHFLCVVSPREKKKKRNINNNLAILPSRDAILANNPALEYLSSHIQHHHSVGISNTILKIVTHLIISFLIVLCKINSWDSNEEYYTFATSFPYILCCLFLT